MRLVEIFSLSISNNENKEINVKDVLRFIPKTEYDVRQIITILIEESKIVSDVYFLTKLELSKAAYYGYSVISTQLNDWFSGQSGIHAIYNVYGCYDKYSRYEEYKDDLEKYATSWVNRLVNVCKFKASTVVYVLASLFRAYGFILKTDESDKQDTYKCSIGFILYEWQELKPIGNISGYSWETGKYSYGANLLFEFQDWQFAQELIMRHYPMLERLVNGAGSIYPVMESSAFQEIKKGNRDEYKKFISKAIGILMNHALYNFEGRRNINLTDFISNGIVNIVEKTNRLLEGTQLYRHLNSSVAQILRKSYIQSVSDSQLVNYDMKFVSDSEKISREISKFEQENEYMSSNEELADRIDWQIEDVDNYMKYSPQYISMDLLCSESCPSEMDEAYIYETLLEDKCTNRASCEDKLLYQSLQIEVDRVLCQLKNRERKIVMMHYGIGGYEPMTLSDIASKFDFTRERVRQIIDQAIKKLKGQRSWCLKPFLGKPDYNIHSSIESNYKYKALTYDLDQIKKEQKEKEEQERLAKKERLAQRWRLELEKQEQERLARKEELAQRRRLEKQEGEQERLVQKQKKENERHVQRVLRAYQEYQEYQQRIAEDKRQEDARSVAKIESQVSVLQTTEKVYYKVKCAENPDEELELVDFEASRLCNDGKDIASKTILNGNICVVATVDAVYLRLIQLNKIVKLCDFHIGNIQDFCVWITQSPIEKEKYKIDIAALFKNIIHRVGYISVSSDIITYIPN